MEVTLNLMPFRKQVHGSWFMVHRFKKETTNYQLPTTNKRHKRLGLTLIELLVVIAILGVLASFTSVAMIGHQKQARDAQRKSDLQQVKKALQSAKNDCKAAAYYPSISITLGNPGEEANYNYLLITGYLTSTNLKYLQSVPNDPKYNASDVTTSYGYMFTAKTTLVCPIATTLAMTLSGVEQFVLRAKLETSKDPDAIKSYTKCTNIANSVNLEFPLNPVPESGDDYFYECSD